MIPAYVAVASVVAAILTAIADALCRAPAVAHKDTPLQNGSRKGLKAHISLHGGTTIFAFNVVRAFCVLALLTIYAYDLARSVLSKSISRDGLVGLVLFVTYVRISASSDDISNLTCPLAIHVVFGPLERCSSIPSSKSGWPALEHHITRQLRRVRLSRYLAAYDLHASTV